MNGDVRRHAALAAESDDASIYIWPEATDWSGMTILKPERSMIQFKAIDEESAKVEGLRLASKPDADWRHLAIIARW